MKNQITRVLLHVTFWAVAWVFLVLFFTRLTMEFKYTLVFSGLLLVIAIGATYWLNYFLVPRFLLKKKYVLFILWSLFTGLVTLWIELYGILAIFMQMRIRFDSTQKGILFFIDPIFLIAGLYFVIIIGVLAHLLRISFKIQKEKHSLEIRNLEVENQLKELELIALKNQFNPHFLFNTLNNLYWLTLNKSENAPDLVLKLSDLLDYGLNRSHSERVPLGEEIEYLQNYLDIIKIRFGDAANIQFGVVGNPENRLVAPFILINFVENACKHGLSEMSGKGWIRICFDILPGEISFSVSNSYSQKPDQKKSSGGCGLAQAKARLEIAYPGSYDLHLACTNNVYKAELKIYD